MNYFFDSLWQVAFFSPYHLLLYIANKAIIQSSSVIIQNTDTTLFSFQPDNSKWWCKGAIFNNLFPPVFLKYTTCITTDKVSNTGIAAITINIKGIFKYNAIADITPT